MRGTPFLLKGFVGGLNTISAPYELDPSETRESLNVVSTTRGSIRKRYGSTLFTPTPPSVELESATVTVFPNFRTLLVAGGGKIYAVNAAGAVEELGSGFESNRWSIVQAPYSTAVANEGPVYLSNGTDKPLYWNGEPTGLKEWTGVSSAPKGTDGKQTEGNNLFESESVGFLGSDVGKLIKFETEVQQKTEGGPVTITEAAIEQVLSPKKIAVSLPSEEWSGAKSNVHFTLERTYYTKAPYVPNGKYSIFAGNRIWMAGIGEDTSAVWFSDFADRPDGSAQADPSAWPATNVVRFDASDGKPITGLGVVGPYVLVFKENKTWVIHNLNTGENRKLSDTTGCVAHRSIVETPEGTFFLTADQGIYLTNGSGLKEMSYKVRPTILAINPKQREKAAGGFYNNHYYLSYASGASETNNRTLDYDNVLKSWWLHDLTSNQWVVHEPSTPGPTSLYAIRPGSGKGVAKAFVEGVYEDCGELYPGDKELSAFWISPWDPFGYYIFRHKVEAPFLKKRIRQLFFDGEGEMVFFVYKNFAGVGTKEPATVGNLPQWAPETPVNFGAGGQKFANPNTEQKFAGEKLNGVTMLFGGVPQVGSARAYALGVARAWSIGYGNRSDQPFEIFSYMLSATFRKS